MCVCMYSTVSMGRRWCISTTNCSDGAVKKKFLCLPWERRLLPDGQHKLVGHHPYKKITTYSLNTSKSSPECCNNALWSGPMLRRPKKLAAVPGHLPGFDCKRRPMRPSATQKFLKWPMAWKRLNSTGLRTMTNANQAPLPRLSKRRWYMEWSGVSSFLTAHQHIKGYFVPSMLLWN